MGNVMSFTEVLEKADVLSLDEQETLMDVLHRRMIDRRRSELVKEIQMAQQEFKKGQCKSATAHEIMEEVLS